MTADVMEIPLTRGYVALIDAADSDLVVSCGPWQAYTAPCTTYARRKTRRPDGSWTRQPLHTFLTGWSYVDHRNGDGLDNRRANLRPATPAQNSANQRVQAASVSGFKGVTRTFARNTSVPWRARIKVNGRVIHLGVFSDPAVAARAYDEAALKHFGEFARTNFPREEYAS